MPSTVVGLVIFIVFLVPGVLHFLQRRAAVPQGAGGLSPLVETASIASISLLTNVLSLSLFGLVRLGLPGHTPDVGRFVKDAGEYTSDRIPYVVAWLVGLVALSCLFAVLLGARTRYQNRLPGFVKEALRRLDPQILNVSAWYSQFEAVPDRYVYVGCDLQDGSYVGGYLAWYSTDTAETADRDLVLASPITLKRSGESQVLDGVHRVVLSAREIVALLLSPWVIFGLAGAVGSRRGRAWPAR
jgi:hypothetical protein